MPRIVVQPGTSQTWEIQLKPGINFLGRGVSNDFRFEDPSISGAHCQLIVENNAVTIRDMGSTNGTFVNRARIQEARLSTGQPLRLGSVDMIFYGDEAEAGKLLAPSAPAAAPGPVLSAAPVPVVTIPPPPISAPKISEAPPAPAPPKPPGLKITGLSQASAPGPATAASESATEFVAAPPIAAVDAGPRFCKFHPKAPARHLCNKCNRSYCETCVTTLNVGGKTKFNCRNCGQECVPLQVHLVQPGPTKGFFASIPDAFVYPVRGSGVFILLVGMVIFAGIKLGNMMMISGVLALNIRNVLLGVGLQVILGGYLFTLLQNMIHATASGENEVPELSGVNFLEDIMMPFFRLLGLVLACFLPAIGLTIAVFVTKMPVLAIGILPAVLFGCVYFPMAFLAVAILDNIGAVNPLAVIPSIMKVPLEYTVTVIVLASVLLITQVGDIGLKLLFPKGLMTESIGELVGMFGLKFLLSLIAVYLLIVKTRILGLLYLCKKDVLGWIGR
jgi:hypothetical protein